MAVSQRKKKIDDHLDEGSRIVVVESMEDSPAPTKLVNCLVAPVKSTRPRLVTVEITSSEPASYIAAAKVLPSKSEPPQFVSPKITYSDSTPIMVEVVMLTEEPAPPQFVSVRKAPVKRKSGKSDSTNQRRPRRIKKSRSK